MLYNIYIIIVFQIVNLIYNKIFDIKTNLKDMFFKSIIYFIILILGDIIKTYNSINIKEVLVGNPNF